jgi:hypothetical protein
MSYSVVGCMIMDEMVRDRRGYPVAGVVEF